jgi:DNA-binding NtrC family response regulator
MNMKNQSLRVSMVDDSEDDVQLIIHELKKGGYNPVYERVETAAAMKKDLQEKQWDIIICDYSLPNFDAPSAIALLKEANIDIPIIIVSDTIGEEKAIECMRLGAQDYIMKGNLSRLCPAIARELKDAEVRSKKKQAEFQREAELDALRQNITEYKLAEAKLQQTIDNLKNVIDASMQVCQRVSYTA